MTRTQAEMEAAYDAERSGAAYIKPTDEQAIADWIDTLLVPEDTDGIISALDGDRRRIDERFDRVIDAVAELPDSQRQIAVALWEGFLAGVAIEEADNKESPGSIVKMLEDIEDHFDRKATRTAPLAGA
jgi:hypothetical protein